MLHCTKIDWIRFIDARLDSSSDQFAADAEVHPQHRRPRQPATAYIPEALGDVLNNILQQYFKRAKLAESPA